MMSSFLIILEHALGLREEVSPDTAVNNYFITPILGSIAIGNYVFYQGVPYQIKGVKDNAIIVGHPSEPGLQIAVQPEYWDKFQYEVKPRTKLKQSFGLFRGV